MTSPTDLARLAAERPLDEAARRALLDACARDPELGEFVAAYRDVHALTGLAVAAAGRARSRRRNRVAIALAAALVALAAIAVVARFAAAPREIDLASIPLAEPPPIVRTQPPLPQQAAATLASWSPRADVPSHWLTSMDEAVAIAAATRRPVLLFVHHAECPWCVAMNEVTWPDARVTELTRDVIPVKVDVMKTSKEFQEQLTGWPYIALKDSGGKVLREFPGFREAEAMSQELKSGLSVADLEAALPWEDARRYAALLASGREAEEQGRLGFALTVYRRLFEAPGAFAEEARDGARRIDQRARQELLAAQGEAREDSSDALERLAHAEETFRGTPHADDLHRVRETLQRTGRFPRLSQRGAIG